MYAVTGGRTRSSGRDLPVESLVTATGRAASDLQKEYRMIVAMATRPVSLVEVGAALGVPFGVARVLVSDLADAGYLDRARAAGREPGRRADPGEPEPAAGGPPCALTLGRSP